MRRENLGRRTILAVWMVFLAACSDSTGARNPSMTGVWDGALLTVPVVLTLSERDQQITGSGNGASLAFSITGTHVHPNVSLILKATGYGDMNFTGAFNGSREVNGNVQGSGFTGQSLILTKRP